MFAMTAFVDGARGTVAALTCVTQPDGHTVCNGVSPAGAFAGLGLLVVVYVAFLVLGIVSMVSILSKAGYSGWWVLIGLVPILGAVMYFVFAFSAWPVTRELQMLRGRGAGGYGSGGYGYGQPGYGGLGAAAPAAMPQQPAGPWTGATPQGPSPNPTVPQVPQDPNATEHSVAHQPIPSFGEVMRGGSVPPTAGVSSVPPGPAAASPVNQPPAGWYPSPDGNPNLLRYWDGSTWTDQRHQQ
jgi:uncharacterized membrane protein YhaH (DUF805 family)